MSWRDYEQEILSDLKAAYPDSNIQYNVKKAGRYSKTIRQIDIMIEEHVAGHKIEIAIEAKLYSRNINVKDVESFIGMLADISVHKGLLITQEGYSEAALARAYNDPSDVELDVWNLKEIERFQAHAALPFSKDVCITLFAPFGWVIDGRSNNNFLAALYQRGRCLEEAIDTNEFMYINFWHKDDKCNNIDALRELQEKNIRNSFPDAQFEYIKTIKRKKEKTLLRKLRTARYPGTEYTGFVEFEKFIFFCVLHTPEYQERRNIQKLEYVIAKAVPGRIEYPEG